MTVLQGYRYMADFFKQLAWWELNPDNDFFEAQGGDGGTGDGALPPVLGLRSDKGDLAVLYFSAGGNVKIKPDALQRSWPAVWFNPRTNERLSTYPDEQGRFVTPDEQDWVLLFGFGLRGTDYVR